MRRQIRGKQLKYIKHELINNIDHLDVIEINDESDVGGRLAVV